MNTTREQDVLRDMPSACNVRDKWSPVSLNVTREVERMKAERLDVYPVTWLDADDIEHNAWSRNHLTNEIEPDPQGEPLYTTVPPASE